MISTSLVNIVWHSMFSTNFQILELNLDTEQVEWDWHSWDHGFSKNEFGVCPETNPSNTIDHLAIACTHMLSIIWFCGFYS